MQNKKVLYVLIGVMAVAVFITFVLVLKNIGNTGGTTGASTTITFWGVYDDHGAFDQVIKDFKTQHPNITVRYQMFSYDTYEQQLINALAAGTGPDIFMIHNTWLPKRGDLLTALPASIPGESQPLFTIQSYKDQFVDVVAQDLTYQNQIYAVPLYVDTLALYYNRDILNNAALTRPPQTWDEVNADVPVLTRFDKQGNIIQSGIALGAARNINRSTDILMNMMIQSGVQMTSSDNLSATFNASVGGQAVGRIALQYYTDFANPRKQVYAWNDSQHYSIDAFTEGNLAMMLSYSHTSALIKAKSPRLNFDIAPMPQASLANVRNFANYWAAGVSKTSKNINASWQFLAYLSSKNGESAYLNATGRPAARRDLIDLQRSDPDIGVFAVQALTARSWFQADNTAIEGIFADMVDDVNFNRMTVPDAISQAQSRVDVLMRK
jgi:multiple sugar transport system substrate-binding protein